MSVAAPSVVAVTDLRRRGCRNERGNRVARVRRLDAHAAPRAARRSTCSPGSRRRSPPRTVTLVGPLCHHRTSPFGKNPRSSFRTSGLSTEPSTGLHGIEHGLDERLRRVPLRQPDRGRRRDPGIAVAYRHKKEGPRAGPSFRARIWLAIPGRETGERNQQCRHLP